MFSHWTQFSCQISVLLYYDANCSDQSHFTDVSFASIYLCYKIKRKISWSCEVKKKEKNTNCLEAKQTLSFTRHFEILKPLWGGASRSLKRHVSTGEFNLVCCKRIFHHPALWSCNLLSACVICHHHVSSHFSWDALPFPPFWPPLINQTTGNRTRASCCPGSTCFQTKFGFVWNFSSPFSLLWLVITLVKHTPPRAKLINLSCTMTAERRDGIVKPVEAEIWLKS